MPKVMKKDPRKPKGAKSAYNYFLQDQKEKMNGEGGMSLQEFSRSCADKWKKMGEEDKKDFAKKAERDKVRYINEMSSYSPPPQEEQDSTLKKRKKKQVKDPNQPKRNISAYFYFLADKRASVKESLENASAGAIVKVLGEMWSKMADEDKVKYHDLAKKDKERYEVEMKAFKSQKEPSTSQKAVPVENGGTEA